MKAAILLGAGSSLPAEFPSTQCLTDLVLSGNSVWRHSDTTYCITGAEPPDEKTRLARSMVRRICAEAERYYLRWACRRPNYEDLYYLARQVFDEEVGNMENPAVRLFANRLTADTSQLISEANTDWPNTLSETCYYIAGIVRGSLCKKEPSTNHLQPIIDACESGQVTGISTLCHDTHVETFLRDKSIKFSDGFDEEPKDGVRYWNNELSSKGKIPFLKLHGSVDWFKYRSGIGIPPANSDPMRTQSPDGVWQYADSALLLIGTFNKILDYSSGIFRELHYHFRVMLCEADRLAVCGYSFGDKGINEEIIEWYKAKCGRRFVIIHPNPDELVADARPAIQDILEKGPVEFINKRLENVDGGELEQAIQRH